MQSLGTKILWNSFGIIYNFIHLIVLKNEYFCICLKQMGILKMKIICRIKNNNVGMCFPLGHCSY